MAAATATAAGSSTTSLSSSLMLLKSHSGLSGLLIKRFWQSVNHKETRIRPPQLQTHRDESEGFVDELRRRRADREAERARSNLPNEAPFLVDMGPNELYQYKNFEKPLNYNSLWATNATPEDQRLIQQHAMTADIFKKYAHRRPVGYDSFLRFAAVHPFIDWLTQARVHFFGVNESSPYSLCDASELVRHFNPHHIAVQYDRVGFRNYNRYMSVVEYIKYLDYPDDPFPGHEKCESIWREYMGATDARIEPLKLYGMPPCGEYVLPVRQANKWFKGYVETFKLDRTPEVVQRRLEKMVPKIERTEGAQRFEAALREAFPDFDIVLSPMKELYDGPHNLTTIENYSPTFVRTKRALLEKYMPYTYEVLYLERARYMMGKLQNRFQEIGPPTKGKSETIILMVDGCLIDLMYQLWTPYRRINVKEMALLTDPDPVLTYDPDWVELAWRNEIYRRQQRWNEDQDRILGAFSRKKKRTIKKVIFWMRDNIPDTRRHLTSLDLNVKGGFIRKGLVYHLRERKRQGFLLGQKLAKEQERLDAINDECARLEEVDETWQRLRDKAETDINKSK